MNTDELFDKIYKTVEKGFENLSNDNEIKSIYQKNQYDYDESLKELKKSIYGELDNCFKNIKEKKVNNADISEGIFLDTDNNKYDVFVILPIFNATNEQAEKCIYSIMDNYEELNYKLLIMSNRKLEVFKVLEENMVPSYIYLKSRFSLPEAYNLMVGYAKNNCVNEDSIISLMDDDAFILTGQNNKIKECYDRVKNDLYVASSGHYYDISPCKTDFEKMVNQTHIYDFVSKYKKPFCHGGASFMLKIKNFPFNGLPITGLGGISINILSVEKNNSDKWFTYNDVELTVFHPRKSNLFAWIATYLSYEIAWERALNMLSKNDRDIWDKELKETSRKRVKGLYERLRNDKQRKYVLGNIFLTRYLKPLLKSNLQYEDFKKYNVSTHINLKQS